MEFKELGRKFLSHWIKVFIQLINLTGKRFMVAIFIQRKLQGLFLMFVWQALQDLTLVILMLCALVSIDVGIITEGWPKGMHDGLESYLL